MHSNLSSIIKTKHHQVSKANSIGCCDWKFDPDIIVFPWRESNNGKTAWENAIHNLILTRNKNKVKMCTVNNLHVWYFSDNAAPRIYFAADSEPVIQFLFKLQLIIYLYMLCPHEPHYHITVSKCAFFSDGISKARSNERIKRDSNVAAGWIYNI